MILYRIIGFVLLAAGIIFPVLSSAQAEDIDSRANNPAAPKVLGGSADASTLAAGSALITPGQFLEAVQNGSLDKVKDCLARGVDINVRNENGESALHLVRDAALAEFLISRGADVNLSDRQFGMTPLFVQEVPIARLLVEAGANLNARSRTGNTPIIWFAYSNYLEGIKYLLSVNADLHAMNNDGRTVLDVAEDFGSPELVRYLRAAGAKKGRQNNSSDNPEDAGWSREIRP